MQFTTFALLCAYVSSFLFAARVMRLLATHHVFVEVSPDVFANNSLSSTLDTGKSVEALFTQYVGISQRKAHSY